MNIKTLILICLSCLFFTLPAQAQRFAQPVVSFQLVYDELSKHGVWLQDKGLGYVWLPFENGNFRPYYTNGYWAMTEYGQSWISYYSWGWAAFHYGRWTYDGYYGWLWVPGSEWGPAWVKWRYNNEMYGWAPLLPGEHADSILEHTPEDWWVFIDKHDLYNARTTTKYNATENDRMLKGTYSLNNKLKN